MSESFSLVKSLRATFVAGYPPWFFKFWIKPSNCKDEAEAHRLLHLLRAIEDGKVDETRTLLSGFDPNLRLAVNEQATQSLLEWACEKSKNPDCIRALVAAGADPKSGHVLRHLLVPPKSALLPELLAAGVDPNAKASAEEMSPLGVVACYGLVDGVRQLLAGGANPNATCAFEVSDKVRADEVTVVMLAAHHSHLGIVKTLIAAGADIHRSDSLGNNVLSWARASRAKAKAAKVIEFLEQAGAQESTGIAAMPAAPDFTERAKSRDFLQAVEIAQKLTGSKTRVLQLAEGPLEGGKAFDLKLKTSETAMNILDRLRPQLAPLGTITFLTEYLVPAGKSRLVLLPTSDIYEAITAFETPEGQPLSSEELIDWLKKLAKSQPFEITTLSPDLLRARFLSEIRNPVGLAEEIARICPDIINESIESVAASLEKSGELYLWWD